MELLSRWFIRDRNNVTDPRVRRAYGQLCGFVGIGLNILLFAGKFFAGTLSGSVAITADAFNNLSDAGSSVVTLLGFRLAGKKPDPQHPFGHGRLEYVSGLIVAGLILLMGVELAKSSVEKILHPAAVDFSVIALVILAVSICVKLYMCLYNRRIGKKIRSAAMEATAADSLSDTAATAAVLLAPYEKDKAGAAALLRDLRAVAAAGLQGSPHAPVQGQQAQRTLRLAEAAIQRLGAQVNPKIVLTVFAARLAHA